MFKRNQCQRGPLSKSKIIKNSHLKEIKVKLVITIGLNILFRYRHTTCPIYFKNFLFLWRWDRAVPFFCQNIHFIMQALQLFIFISTYNKISKKIINFQKNIYQLFRLHLRHAYQLPTRPLRRNIRPYY